MAFYGPTFPNETNYERLLSGRQRFGNRSANMFFVRPARHIACPRRLKYIHDIKTGYIPYVEDSAYDNQPSYRHAFQKVSDDDMNKTNGLGLYNLADEWRQELMELAQQVKSSFNSADEQEQYYQRSRSSRLNKHRHKRSSTVSNYHFEDNDEQNLSKRLLHRRPSASYRRSQARKPKTSDEKSEQEQSINDENQDPGIWLIPILCYILQVDNILEAQDWLVNANPTEKRLAMELISRTMQDMQNFENDLTSDVSASDLSTTSSNLNNAYWPYKVLKRQEKERQQQQQQQVQHYLKQSKLTSQPSLLSLTVDNGDTCERATSPLRMLTPANRRPPSSNNVFTPIETPVVERSPTRNTNDPATPTIVVRQNPSQMTDRPSTVKQPLSSRISTARSPNGSERLSRRGYRVKTSLNNSTDDNMKPISPTLRGKTPLI